MKKKKVVVIVFMAVYLFVFPHFITKVFAQSSTFSLDRIMTKDEQVSTGVIKLNNRERKNLENWLKKWTLKVFTFATQKEYVGVGSEHWISENLNGKILELEDGSLWLVSSIDRINTSLWLPTESIIVKEDKNSFYPYKLVNTDNNESAEVRYLGKE